MDIYILQDGHVSPSERPLTEIASECQDEMNRFKASSDHHQDSACCAEIVRRASKGDRSALETLVDITTPYIRRDCDKHLDLRKELIDDAQQDVILRLVDKFQNKKSPYQARSMGEYLSYVKLVAYSVSMNMLRRPIPLSIEELEKDSGFEIEADRNDINEVERRILFNQALASIDDPLDKKLILLRYKYDLTPQQIFIWLDSRQVNIKIDDIYRRLEKCIVKLKDTFSDAKPSSQSTKRHPKS